MDRLVHKSDCDLAAMDGLSMDRSTEHIPADQNLTADDLSMDRLLHKSDSGQVAMDDR
jgi:hypothetical protein